MFLKFSCFSQGGCRGLLFILLVLLSGLVSELLSSPLGSDMRPRVVEVLCCVGGNLGKICVICVVDGGESEDRSGLLVDKRSKLSLSLGDDIRDIFISAERWEPHHNLFKEKEFSKEEKE